MLGIKVRQYYYLEQGLRGTTDETWLKLYYAFSETVPLHELMKKTHISKDQ